MSRGIFFTAYCNLPPFKLCFYQLQSCLLKHFLLTWKEPPNMSFCQTAVVLSWFFWNWSFVERPHCSLYFYLASYVDARNPFFFFFCITGSWHLKLRLKYVTDSSCQLHHSQFSQAKGQWCWDGKLLFFYLINIYTNVYNGEILTSLLIY